MPASPAEILKDARLRANLNQRELARRAGTAQSVVARIELGRTSPSWDTLARLLDAAGFAIEPRLDTAQSDLGPLLGDTARILALAPADRLRELRNSERFLATVHRA